MEGDVNVEPRPPCFTGPIVILVNAETGSAAEWFAMTLRRERNALLIGERTAGAEAGVEHVTGPDGTTLVYGWRWLMDAEGRHPLQDVGLTPDVSIPLTLEDVQRVGYLRAQREVRERRLRAALERLGASERFDEPLEPMLQSPGAMWECGRH
jgi:C-terminal processing protease CtpA/Prc